MEWMTAATGLPPSSLLWCMVVVFVAAAIRGFSGFGLSALLVASMSLILPPAEIVPVTLLLEAVASVAMLPAIRRDLDWKIMGGLLAGAVPTLPLGAWLLAGLSDAVMRVVVSVLVLAASMMVWRGFHFRERRGPGSHGLAGAVSGALFGIAAIGGLPVVIYLLAASVAATSARAVLALHLMLMGLYGAAVTGAFGLFTMESLWRVMLFLPPLLAGVVIGGRHFQVSGHQNWRRFTLALLISLSIMGLIRALAG